jgi:hypothetical protein
MHDFVGQVSEEEVVKKYEVEKKKKRNDMVKGKKEKYNERKMNKFLHYFHICTD